MKASHAVVAMLCAATRAGAQMTWNTLGLLPVFPDAMTYDEVRDRVVVYQFQGTWEFDGLAWTMVASSPAPAHGGPMVYDAARRRTVLYLRDLGARETWEWDGVSWSLCNAACPEFELLAYHSARGRVMAFGGGYSSSFPSSDLYEWDGTNWALVPTANRPPRHPNGNPGTWISYWSMVSDDRRSALVVHGSSSWNGAIGMYMPVTWEWTSITGWSNPPAGGPPNSIGLRTVFDSQRGIVPLLAEDRTHVTSLWEWDGTGTWQPLSAQGAGPAVGEVLMDAVYDPQRGRSLVVTYDMVANNTLRSLSAANPADYTVYGPGCSAPAGPGPDLHLSTPWSRAWVHSTWPFSVEVSGMPQSLGVLGMGLFAGPPYPIDLGPLGMPGCFLHLQPEASLLVAGAGGRVTIAQAIPPNLALLGQVFFEQAFALAPGANAAGVLATPSRRGVVGLLR